MNSAGFFDAELLQWSALLCASQTFQSNGHTPAEWCRVWSRPQTSETRVRLPYLHRQAKPSPSQCWLNASCRDPFLHQPDLPVLARSRRRISSIALPRPKVSCVSLPSLEGSPKCFLPSPVGSPRCCLPGLQEVPGVPFPAHRKYQVLLPQPCR